MPDINARCVRYDHVVAFIAVRSQARNRNPGEACHASDCQDALVM